MKIIKKILIGLGIFMALLVVAAIVVPILFKDDIKAAVDEAIAKNINADVIFETDNFNLSVFRHFPNITAEIKELGVFNRAPFEGVPLFVVDRIEVEINLMDMLFGDQLRIKGITLVRPQINIQVKKDGQANYNITYPPTDTVKTEESPGSFSFGIDHWEVTDGQVVYDDKSLPYFLEVRGLQHDGSGDFTQDVFDLRTHTVADTVTTSYGTMELLTNKRVEMNATISISEDVTKYTFKENEVKVNDFGVSFDGWFKMNPSDYGMDITFKSPENSFKSLLSLVPGMYTQDYSKIETKGSLSFAGAVKGTYSEKQMPAFNLNLKVSDAMFKYPDLPTAVDNINLDLLVENKDGIVNNTMVDLKKLHLDFGSNPLDARLLIQNLVDYNMDGKIKATLNLAELNKMFPMEGLEMRGNYSIDGTATGVYDSIKKTIPKLDVSMALASGYIKSSQVPVPLQDLKFNANIRNTTGKMAETVIAVKDFGMVLEGEKLTANMTIQNLNDYTWDINASGGVDLAKITRIFPVEGTTLEGKIKATIDTKGKMSDVTAKRYDKLPTSGSLTIANFKYVSKSLPYAVTIRQAEGVFDPKKIELKQMVGTIGKSDFDVKGQVSNYIGYVLGKGTITGNVGYKSTLLDLNEFMSESPSASATPDTSQLEVIHIPADIDFVFHSTIGTVKMMEYSMTGATGDIIVRGGIVNLNGLKFNMLGGAFVVNGSYNTKDKLHPKYDFALNIDNMSIQEAAHSFSIVKTYAPIAGFVNGNFNTDFKVGGELQQNMMPNLATVNGGGIVKILNATLTDSKVISGITSITKLEDTNNVTLKDVLMNVTIANGRLTVKPFDVQLGKYKANVAGSTGLDASIDYTVKMNVPAGKVGAQYQAFVNKYAGTNNPTSEIPLTIGITGNYNNPKTTLITTEQEKQAKEAATKAAEEKAKEALGNLLGNKKQDTTKTDTTKTAKPEPAKELQDKLQNLLKKKKK